VKSPVPGTKVSGALLGQNQNYLNMFCKIGVICHGVSTQVAK